MLDATLIEAAAAPGTGGRGTPARPSRDPDAAFGGARKKGGFTFGYKANVGVDEGSGLIRTVSTTPAKERHDPGGRHRPPMWGEIARCRWRWNIARRSGLRTSASRRAKVC